MFLPLEQRRAEVAEEFTAGGFEQIQITGVINVIAGGAFGVSDAMRVFEGGDSHDTEALGAVQ